MTLISEVEKSLGINSKVFDSEQINTSAEKPVRGDEVKIY